MIRFSIAFLVISSILFGCQTFSFSTEDLKTQPYLGRWEGKTKEGAFIKTDIDKQFIYSKVYFPTENDLNSWQKYKYSAADNNLYLELIEYFDIKKNEWKKPKLLTTNTTKYNVFNFMLELDIIKYYDEDINDHRYQTLQVRPKKDFNYNMEYLKLVPIPNNFEKTKTNVIPFNSDLWKSEASLKPYQYVSPTIVGESLPSYMFIYESLLGNIQSISDRQRMLPNLLPKLKGKTFSQITELLGPKSETNYWSESNPNLIYVLGPEPGFVSIDSQWLLLWFENNTFIRYEIKTD